jgi:hypothetical protein
MITEVSITKILDSTFGVLTFAFFLVLPGWVVFFAVGDEVVDDSFFFTIKNCGYSNLFHLKYQ